LIKEKGRYSDTEPMYLRSLEILMQKLGQDHPNTQSVMSSLMMLKLQISTGLDSATLEQMIQNNPDEIMQLLQK
jgi:hypothetical protein